MAQLKDLRLSRLLLKYARFGRLQDHFTVDFLVELLLSCLLLLKLCFLLHDGFKLQLFRTLTFLQFSVVIAITERYTVILHACL